MIKAKGRAGSWHAVPDGEAEELPCVHRKWHKPKKGTYGYYSDHGAYSSDKKIWDKFIDAIKTKKRVLLTEEYPETKRRAKYIAIYKVDNVVVNESGLHFDFTERLKG
jgi:hypothetical protein